MRKFFYYILCLFLLAACRDKEAVPTLHVVTTLAGSGKTGSKDGQGVEAEFSYPQGIVVDAAGNVVVADGNRLRRITPTGLVQTIFVGPELAELVGLAIDRQGNYLASDRNGNQILKISPLGVVVVIAGNGKSGNADGVGEAAQFRAPSGMSIDANDNLYLADRDNHCIRKITPAGQVSTVAGGIDPTTNLPSSMIGPNAIALGKEGTMYIAEFIKSQIRKITPDGQNTILTPSFVPGAHWQLSSPTSLTIDAEGNLLVATAGGIGTIFQVTATGELLQQAGIGVSGFADGDALTEAQFNFPAAIATDSNGNLYVGDVNNNRIRKVKIQ